MGIEYIVVNQEGKAYCGMLRGQFQYSEDWNEAKPLEKPFTTYLMREKGNELIKYSEL